MKFVLGTAALFAAATLAGGASAQTDGRSGLKAGIRDAGQAASHVSLVSTTPVPQGFRTPYYDTGAMPAGAPPVSALAFANSDLAFQGNRLFQGNFQGWNVWDISNPAQPKVLASIVCPAGQGDVAVHGNLLFLSVEPPSGRNDCGAGGAGDAKAPSKDRFRGVRIFDITNLTDPKQIAAIQTCQGSHTVTLVPDKRDPKTLYAYSSGLAGVRSSEELAGCSTDEKDPNTPLFSIDVIKVPLDNPSKAAVIGRPRLFADAAGNIAGLAKGGTEGTNMPSMQTRNCHDITAYPEIGLAGGACMGNGLLIDIRDPANPKRLDAATDPNFGTWHSATFNNKGDTVLFTDEWGGGTQPRCRPQDPQYWGGDATFTIKDGKMVHQGYYKIPNTQGPTENCVAHNGNLIPVPGRDVMVQSWYQGGLSVFDFTDTKKPVEIAYFDRGPLNGSELWIGGYWSTYWYNGRIYGSEIGRGLDVLKLEPSDMLTKNELAAAELIKETVSNPQTQTKIVWPDKPVVARAYLDQLNRGKAISSTRASAVDAALSAMEKGSKGANAALIGQLKADAAKATGRDAERFEGIARILGKA